MNRLAIALESIRRRIDLILNARYARIPQDYQGPREYLVDLPIEFLSKSYPEASEGTEVYLVEHGRLRILDSNIEMEAL
jgi:hypothetical protein